MMRRVVIGILLGCAMLASAQGLRHSVCVVYPEFSTEDSTLLSGFAKQLARVGYTDDAKMLTGYACGGFGSGVLTETCVLTNRHVVGYAETVKLVFELHDKVLRFPGCKVLQVSEESDLAAIELPNDLTDLVALPISTEAVVDDEDIYAAGFPGLANAPSWQLTRGTVSNAHLRLEKSAGYAIQHTAAIDPGSSGGPLLRKRDGKYEVIGINTLKAFYRDRVGLALQSQDVLLFVGSVSPAADNLNSILKSLEPLDIEAWSKYYSQLPDSMKQSFRSNDLRLPLNVVTTTIDYYGGTDKVQQKSDKTPDKRLKDNRIGIADLDDDWALYLDYSYMTRYGSHLPAIRMDMTSFNYLVYGGEALLPISNERIPYEEDRYALSFGFGVGVHMGARVPVRIAHKHSLVPRVTGGYALTIPIKRFNVHHAFQLRPQIEYRYQGNTYDFILGAGYMFEVSSYRDHGVSVFIGFAY